MTATATPSIAPTENFNIVIVGHVDHGKSTLLGRLYHDTGSMPKEHIERVKKICDQQGKQFEYAFLFDAFLEEQEQGITIDTARTFFKWKNREYILIDAPGHKEFLKNMISGASRAEAALLLIDASEGVKEQSKRHGYMLSLLGIPQVGVVVNKMDLVGYDQKVFQDIEKEYRAFLKTINVEPSMFIPVSAREGDNIANRSEHMPWYTGTTVLDALGMFKKEAERHLKPFRMSVQDVYKFDERRIIAGRVTAGRLKVGDRVIFSPSMKTARVKRIEAFNVDPLPTEARPGHSAGFTMDEQIFVERGEIAHHTDSLPLVGDRVKANLFWMGRAPLVMGKKYQLRCATREVECEVAVIHRIIDATDLAAIGEQKQQIDRHDVAEVTFRTRKPIAFDKYSDFVNTGRFVIVDDYDISGGGIIMDVVRDEVDAVRDRARIRDVQWVRGRVTMDSRATRNGHPPALILFTGTTGSGKALLAAELEDALFQCGLQAYLLDGANIKAGLDRGEEIDQPELERRFGEVAHILLRAGQVVICTTNAFAQADPEFLRPIVEPSLMLEVHISKDESEMTPLSADLHLKKVEHVQPAIDAIMELLKKHKVLPK